MGGDYLSPGLNFGSYRRTIYEGKKFYIRDGRPVLKLSLVRKLIMEDGGSRFR